MNCKKVFMLLILIMTVSIFSAKTKKVTSKESISNPVVLKKEIVYPPDIEKIIKKGKLTVGIYFESMPPFFMKHKNGELYGLDIELALAVARSLNVGIEYNQEAKSYKELVEKVAYGEVDVIIAKLSMTMPRAKFISYTKPYINLRQGLLINRMEALKLNIEDYPISYLKFKKFKIGVLEKTSYVDFANDLFKQAEVVEFKTWDKVVEALMKGEILAAMYDENEIIQLIKHKPHIALYAKLFILEDKKDYLSMAVAWQNTHLLSYLNTFLELNDFKKNMNDLIKDFPEFYDEESQLKGEKNE